MRIQFLRGGTDENNQLVLPEGYLTVDIEKKAIRIHDGSTPGGYEAVGVRAYEPPSSPGPQELIAGDEEAGFYGEVSAADLIDGLTLAAEIGLSAGTAFNHDSSWLKFAYQGRKLYVAKKPFRYGLPFNSISQLGADYGNVTVTVGNYLFKVRLLTGADTDPTSITRSTYDPVGTHNSEWNQLMYRINETEIASDPRPKWATYTDQDLSLGQVYHEGVLGTLSYVSNRHTQWGCVHRGGGVITFFGAAGVLNADVHHGWRPVLELVQ